MSVLQSSTGVFLASLTASCSNGCEANNLACMANFSCASSFCLLFSALACLYDIGIMSFGRYRFWWRLLVQAEDDDEGAKGEVQHKCEGRYQSGPRYPGSTRVPVNVPVSMCEICWGIWATCLERDKNAPWDRGKCQLSLLQYIQTDSIEMLECTTVMPIARHRIEHIVKESCCRKQDVGDGCNSDGERLPPRVVGGGSVHF